jgi:predicted CoA-substrate-specific enzyme activase
MIGAGIDAGSRAIKVVLIDAASREIIGSGVREQGIEQDRLARELFFDVLTLSGARREDIGVIVATGYGRDMLTLADTTITEITCHSRGVLHEAPDARTIIDIGGQDSKLLRIDAGGQVRDFVMNDRCAAGTGRFLEVVAGRLEIGLNDLGAMAQAARNPAVISSMCVVFAETEIIGLLASGEAPENIVAGVQGAIAARIAAMAAGQIAEPIFFTGGVALIPGMAAALESVLQRPVCIASNPQMTGALGAAILACRNLSSFP